MPQKIATIVVDNEISFKRLEDGRTEICLISHKPLGRNQYAIKDRLNEAEDKLTLSIDKYREKRSLDANAYFWKLINELAAEMNLPDVELYRRYIKENGLKRTEELSDEFYKTVSYVWSHRGIGWFSEKTDNGTKPGSSLYTFYYGSSCYNSKQMSRLIDAAVEDCRELGIETLPPEEVRGMLEAWNGRKQ